MKWETPSAIDLRFGFEITMYIANRYSFLKGRDSCPGLSSFEL
jgi:coenzyme PQQ precursor peptide PqqA